MIPLSVPQIEGNEWRYVKECLDSGWVSAAGGFVDQFERDFASYSGAPHAIACINGTAALHLALRLVGVSPGDEVLVPALTFIASVNVVRYLSAEPVFMDCDDYYNIDIEKTLDFINKETVYRDGYSFNRSTGRRIAAIMPVHVFGNAARVEELVTVGRERGIPVVEDAAESIGTKYDDGRHTGTIGEIGCFSFNGNKLLTTGGGGMIVTNNAAHAERATYLVKQAKDDALRYVHNEVGYNYRLTNVQAAIGVAQLEQVERYVAIKRKNYQEYKVALDGIDGLMLADTPPYARNNCWMYALRLHSDRYGMDRDSLIAALQEAGIQVRPVWYPNHLQKPYQGCQAYRIEHAMALFGETVNIPCSVGLTESDRDAVIRALKP